MEWISVEDIWCVGYWTVVCDIVGWLFYIFFRQKFNKPSDCDSVLLCSALLKSLTKFLILYFQYIFLPAGPTGMAETSW